MLAIPYMLKYKTHRTKYLISNLFFFLYNHDVNLVGPLYSSLAPHIPSHIWLPWVPNLINSLLDPAFPFK